MSAGLDALDRGVVDVGLLAAEALARVEALEARVAALEKQTPQARQLEYEADVAMADAAEYDRHGDGCQCAYCYYEPGDLA